jgi:hypothetical protein
LPKAGFDYSTYLAARTAFVNAIPFLNGIDRTTTQATYDAADAAYLVKLKSLVTPLALVGTVGSETAWGASVTDAQKALFTDGLYSNYKLLRDDVATNLLAKIPTTIGTGSSATIDQYNAAKDAHTLAVAAVFPTYEEIINAGRSAAAVKAGADGVYVIEKPIAQTLDTRTIFFDLKVTNFESPVAPAAALASSFTGEESVKKELLTFVKTVSGPGILPNAAFNTANTKVAIELNHTGVQIQSFGGGRLIIDDKIQGNLKPNGVNEWNSTFPPIPEIEVQNHLSSTSQSGLY